MSLTRHLKNPSSPVRRWFAERLPHTAAVARDANHVLRGSTNQRERRIVAPGRAKEPHALDRELNGLAAASRLLEAPEQKAELRQLAPTDLRERRLPGPHHVDARDGRALDAHRGRDARPYDDAPSAVAGGAPLECTGTQHRSSEQIERGAGQRVVGRAARQVREAPPTLAGYTGALVDADAMEDVATAAPAMAADHADLRKVERLEFGPPFGLSRELGGADADVIADDLLLDFKATSTTRIAGRSELWQLAGYALADLEDEYGVRSVGISALRWRRRWTLPLDELLERVAGRPVSLEEARRAFASMVRESSPAWQRRGPLRRSEGQR